MKDLLWREKYIENVIADVRAMPEASDPRIVRLIELAESLQPSERQPVLSDTAALSLLSCGACGSEKVTLAFSSAEQRRNPRRCKRCVKEDRAFGSHRAPVEPVLTTYCSEAEAERMGEAGARILGQVMTKGFVTTSFRQSIRFQYRLSEGQINALVSEAVEQAQIEKGAPV